MTAVIAAVIAGALAAVARYLATRYVTAPWGVLAVNVVGSAIGGAVLGLAELGMMGADARLILLGGLCGGLTTFSTFSVETVQLAVAGRWRTVILSVVLNLTLGLAAAAAAYLIVLAQA